MNLMMIENVFREDRGNVFMNSNVENIPWNNSAWMQ